MVVEVLGLEGGGVVVGDWCIGVSGGGGGGGKHLLSSLAQAPKDVNKCLGSFFLFFRVGFSF